MVVERGLPLVGRCIGLLHFRLCLSVVVVVVVVVVIRLYVRWVASHSAPRSARGAREMPGIPDVCLRASRHVTVATFTSVPQVVG